MALDDLLTLTAEQKEKVAALLDEVSGLQAPSMLADKDTRQVYVPVDEGEIRTFHYLPQHKRVKRPIVLVPGWGAIPSGFQDFFNVVYNHAEVILIETREKGSSRLQRRRARLDMSQKARDIQAVLNHFDLNGNRDFLLMGTCWGASVILQGLMDRTIQAATVVAFDPMHTLWFPKWIIRYLGPVTPSWFWALVKPLAKTIALWGMEAETQRQRSEAFIDNATVWKWKRAAQQCVDFELLGRVGNIQQEVFIFNGTGDKIHDQSYYPKIAREMPRGRFIYMQTSESRRETLVGRIALEFAKVDQAAGLPALFDTFEKKLDRSL